MSVSGGAPPTLEALAELVDVDRRAGVSPLITLLELARAGVEALAKLVPGLEVVDNNSYDFIESRLETILSMESFSIAEYTYRLPAGGRPGLRFWLDNRGERPQVEVVYFEDVEQWRVDFDGEKLSETLLVLELADDAFEVISQSAEGAASGPWTVQVLSALRRPL